jgi:HEAT repeat protein
MNRLKIALVVLAVALVGLILWQVVRQREPVYAGTNLSTWLKALYIPISSSSDRWEELDKCKDAEEAVRQAGTNAIPTLLRLLRAKDSALKTKLIDLLNSQHIIKIAYTSAGWWNAYAELGFQCLGTNAQSAVPPLTKIAEQNISPRSRASAIDSLGHIGPPAKTAVPLLLEWSTNSDPYIRGSVKRALLNIDPETAAKVGIK